MDYNSVIIWFFYSIKVPKIRQFCSTHIIQVDIKIYSTFLNTGSDEHTSGSIDESFIILSIKQWITYSEAIILLKPRHSPFQ